MGIRQICRALVVSAWLAFLPNGASAGSITAQQCVALKEGMQASLTQTKHLSDVAIKQLVALTGLSLVVTKLDQTTGAELSRELKKFADSIQFDVNDYARKIDGAVEALKAACNS